MGTVRVYPNPYVHLDHEGRPAGACPADPAHQPDRRAWVGATLDREKTIVTDEPAPGERRSPTQVTVFAFRAETIELPDTPYYLDRIRDGELIAADVRTARMVGIPFVEPAVALRRARDLAEAAWRALYGEPPPGLASFVFDILGPAPPPAPAPAADPSPLPEPEPRPEEPPPAPEEKPS